MKKADKIEKLKCKLPISVILRIVQHLQTKECLRFMCINKYVRETIFYEPEFEGQWVIKSFNQLLSKSGITGVRNSNLKKIDVQYRPMHF